MADYLRNRMISWKKANRNPYCVLRLALRKSGVITVEDVRKHCKQVKDPQAALLSMTNGTSYPRLFIQIDAQTYKTLAPVLRLATELYSS